MGGNAIELPPLSLKGEELMNTSSKKFHHRAITSAIALCCTAMAGTTLQAQAQQEEIEEIRVTGSLLTRQTDMPQPVSIIDNQEIQLEQKHTIAEMFRDLPQSTGAVSNVNTQEGAGNSSTTTLNLRGLGFRSNLVLLNGKRQTIDGSGDGVDVNNMAPSIMIDRIEVLADGASALYGSDAVSGVVNFITRNDFDGTEVRLNLQEVQDKTLRSAPDINFGFLTGAQGTDSSVVAGLEVTRKQEILAEEVFDPDRMLITLQSSFANPGSFVPGAFGSPVAGRFPDPLCEDERFTGSDGLSANLNRGTRCVQINAKGRSMQSESQEIRGLAVMNQNFGNNIQGEFEIGAAHKEFEIPFGFVTPLLFPLPVIPANHPGVIAANAADPDFQIQPYRWWGRPISMLGRKTGAIHTADSDTFRVAATFDGPIGDTAWNWQAGGTWSRNEETFQSWDSLNDRLLRALNGYGGPGCGQTPESDPEGEFQGVGECKWFNPFGNHALASPGDPEFNDPDVLDWFIGRRVRSGEAELTTFDVLLSGELFELPGGPTAVGIGYQFREQKFGRDWDDITNGGFNPNTGVGFRFNQDAFPDFRGKRETDAVFGELVLLPTEELEVQLAGRWEDTDGESSVDPKIGVIWAPAAMNNNLFIRGTFGTSFRLAREIEVFGRSSGPSSTRSIGGEGINARGVAVGNPDLAPEESDNFTIGVTWDINNNTSVSLDYWRIDFENLVVAEDPDILLTRDMEDGFMDDLPNKIVLREGVPTEVCEVTGRWDPDSGMDAPSDCFRGTDIQTIVTSFLNQDFQNTAGFDFNAEYNWGAMNSDWRLRLNGVVTTKYDVSTTGEVFDGVGKLNSLNFGAPNARWRGNLALDWRRDQHFARATLRYISELEEDDKEGSPLTEEDDWISMDLVAGTSYRGIEFTASVINLWDEEDPASQNTLLPATSSIYDWRGRVFRLGFSWSSQ